ncbi:uncharacterized protein LOC125232313 [Leguminivora glycinivorella]|uniref:uncharacterized protein LOC125232313 n=1 Tax=Leguminivora glycinivorella TaxID=1035111 RepID=UPI00200DD954|nr:uncharacterized protein LOC125232313 [Leguminivora glycinivorella]
MGAATANSTLRYGLTVETPRSPSYDTTLLWRRDLAKRLRRRSRPTPIPARHPKAAVIDRTTEKRKSLQETTKEVNKPIIKAQSVRSHASSRTVIEAQLSQAELEASERLAEISRRELQLEADMVRKRLDARKLQIRANADSADEHESAGSVRNSNQDRLDEWLENSRDATSKPICKRLTDEPLPKYETPRRPAQAERHIRGLSPDRQLWISIEGIMPITPCSSERLRTGCRRIFEADGATTRRNIETARTRRFCSWRISSWRRANRRCPSVTPAPPRGRQHEVQKVTYATRQATTSRSTTCLFCGGGHLTPDCRKLAAQSVGARWEWAKLNRICYRCIDAKHMKTQCKAKACGVAGCPHVHHRLLHADSPQEVREDTAMVLTQEIRSAPTSSAVTSSAEPADTTEPRAADDENDARVYVSSTPDYSVLLKVLPVTVSGPKGTAHIFAFLDDGSTLSMIDQDVADEIGAVGQDEPLCIRGIQRLKLSSVTQTVKAKVSPARGGLTYDISLKTVDGLGIRSQSLNKKRLLEYEHLADLGDECYTGMGVPQMLIGGDFSHLINPTEVRQGGEDEPCAVKTSLGWVFFGRMPRYVPNNEQVVMHCHSDDSDLVEQVKKHWAVEALGITAKDNIRPDDQRAIDTFERTVKKVGQRYEVGQLWAADDIKLPPSFNMAKARLRNLEARMSRDPDFANEYQAQIHKLLEKGYAERIMEPPQSDRMWFLPHFSNPADRATRCQPAQSVRIEDEWYEGPRFLYGPETSWPSHTSNRTDDLPERKARPSTETSLAIISAKPDPSSVLPDVRRFSSYDRLLNATANVLLFIEKMRTKNKALQLQVRHLRKAEHMWLQYSQRRSFPEELRALSQNRLIDRKSRLYDLAPELGDDGVLRMKTRLGSAPVLYTALQPIILDGREPFTRLLILRAHRRSAHIHNEAVINELRQEYWILHLRPTVKSVARNCALCTLRRATPRAQPLGDLPPERLQAYQRPFTHTAQDYMGPMFVTIGRRREKRWVCLYTCLVTRAIHLESVHSLSTDSALLSLRRFAARRGWPRTMYSDNATCFRAAATELREAYRQWLPVLQTYATQNRMEWKFIPPGNPSAGGAWERMIRTVKIAMSYTFNERAPKSEVFETLLAEIENIVNRRPLTHVNVDPDSEESLTPAHFLLLHNANLPMIGVYDENEKKQWKMAQALADHFWRRWTKEYFPLLAPRKSSHDGGRQLQPGDVVIVAEPNGPRSVWPRGVVETTYPGPDGRVRSADIRTRHGTLRRPSCRLAVIASQPMHQESSTAGTKC